MFADSLEDAERDEWERTRFLAYSVLQSQSKKKMKPTDIIKFKWDNEMTHEATTKEQFEEYKKKMGF